LKKAVQDYLGDGLPMRSKLARHHPMFSSFPLINTLERETEVLPDTEFPTT
jgi:hypothetical protein